MKTYSVREANGLDLPFESITAPSPRAARRQYRKKHQMEVTRKLECKER